MDKLLLENEVVRLRHEAIPIKKGERLGMLIHGLTDYGRIIDIDQLKQMQADISPQDMRVWLNRLVSQNPTVFVV